MSWECLSDQCFQTGKQTLWGQWHPEKNDGLTPNQIRYMAAIKA